uniref:Uncharacterized protein n=1 Tax=Ditylenchus dipsaci TaxID=166011 RepID=A0A915EHU8_9BILA
MANPLEMSKMGGQGPLGFKSDKTSFVSFSSGGYGKSRRTVHQARLQPFLQQKAISTALHHISDDEEPTDKRRKEQQILTNTLLHNIMSGRRDEDQSESIEKSVKEVELIKVLLIWVV